jgi:hypothetical protein
MCSSTIFSAGKSLQQPRQMALDEHRLAIEHVDLGVDHFAVQQERHADFLHRRDRLVGLGELGDAGIGIGGRAGRVILHRVHEAAFAARGGFRPASCCR